jgi:hypothetical protein
MTLKPFALTQLIVFAFSFSVSGQEDAFFSEKLNSTHGITSVIDSTFYDSKELKTLEFRTGKSCLLCESWKRIGFYKNGHKQYNVPRF